VILFGTHTSIAPTSQHGQFVCPECGEKTSYAHARRQSCFHVFFLPVMTLSDEADGIICGSCHHHMDESVVYRTREKTEADKWACRKCGRTWPQTNVRCPVCKVRPEP